MKLLMFTDKMDYLKILKVFLDEMEIAVDIQMVSACALTNAVLKGDHDLILLDDRYVHHLNDDLMTILKDSKADILVFLEHKADIKRYLSLNLLGYFVTPIQWQKVVARLKTLIHREKFLETMEGASEGKYIVRDHNAVYFVPFSEILFFEKYEKKVKIHTRAHIYDVKDSLKSILAIMPKDFIRVHSSYVVNFSNANEIIENHRNYTITFKDYGNPAPMSRKKANELLEDGENRYRLSFIKHIRKD